MTDFTHLHEALLNPIQTNICGAARGCIINFATREYRMDQMAALSHLRSMIRAAKAKNDVEALQQALQDMLVFVEKSLGRKG